MDFSDSRIKDAYTHWILSKQNPKRAFLTKKFLDTFFDVILENERDPTAFCLSLTQAATCVGMEKNNFKKRIDPDFTPEDQKMPPFEKEVDFTYRDVVDGANRQQKELYMTLDTFKRAASNLHNSVGQQITEYLWIAERSLREWFGFTARNKLASHPYENVKVLNSITIAPEVHLSHGIGNYTIAFRYKDVDYYYTGVTDNIRYRLDTHALEFPPGCDITLIEWTPSEDAELIEKCREKFGREGKVPVPECLHGMRSLFYANPQFWKEVVDHCNEMINDSNGSWHPSHKPEVRVLEDPDQYPTRRSRRYPRKRRHNWFDRPIGSCARK
jgi:hypothetical protein